MIVIEGPDNSGKSTLAQFIAEGELIQGSEGPPKWRGEISERIDKYNSFPETTIFDRHPAISNPIYDEARPEYRRDPIPTTILANFYQQQNLFIYCDPTDRGMVGHEIKIVDSQEHLKDITDHRDIIVNLYRKWAIRHAHLVYRIGDDMNFIRWIVRSWQYNTNFLRRIG